jgi:hypothetical protein
MSSSATGKKIFRRPVCPFCGMPIEKPTEQTNRMPVEMPVGFCSCGAVYACDETGHNLGAAMLEALMYACGLDADLASGLLPEDDYLQEIVERYDYLTHLIIPGGAMEGRRIRGALFFIRLHEDVQEVTRPEAEKIISRGIHGQERRKASKPPISATPLTKRQVEALVEAYDIKAAIEAAPGDKKLVRNLQRLLYSGDMLTRKRAADILGQVCAVIAEYSPGTVSRLLQSLFTAVSDTAAFTWGAFEAIGEIIRCEPGLFGPYVTFLSPYLSDDTRISQTLEAMQRVSERRPQLLQKTAFRLAGFLDHPDPSVRGNAARILGFLGSSDMAGPLKQLVDDHGMLNVYNLGRIQKVSVGKLASEALKTL